MMQHPKLSQLLEAHKGSPESLEKAFEQQWRIRDGYFARPETILDLLSSYDEYLRTKGRSGGRQLDGQGTFNEFRRYYDEEPFERIAKIAKEVDRNAPGRTTEDSSSSTATTSLADFTVDMPDLEALREDLARHKDVQDRVKYYCHDERGRAALMAFDAIIGNTRQINAAATFHTSERNVGFQTHLRSKRDIRKVRQMQEAERGAELKGSRRLKFMFKPNQAAARAMPLQYLLEKTQDDRADQAFHDEVFRRKQKLPPGTYDYYREKAKESSVSPHPSAFAGELRANDVRIRLAEEAGAKKVGAIPTRRSAPGATMFSGAPLRMDSRDQLQSREAAKDAAKIVLHLLAEQKRADLDSTELGHGELASTERAPLPTESVEHVMEIMRREMPATRAWLEQRGILVVENTTRGNNCLISALLQHATGDYGKDKHVAEAADLRRRIVEKFDSVQEGDMLYGDNVVFQTLLGWINEAKGRNMNVVFVRPQAGAVPFVLPVTGKEGDEMVAILQGPNHFEALIKG
jgi:hypothetical protein